MKTEWDYTNLAEAYLKRPGYAHSAIMSMLSISGVQEGDKVCDVGAGAAHLTLELAECGLDVSAIEPNDSMRANGIKRTKKYEKVVWYEGVGEHTGMKDNDYKLVTFGSSFNVCNRQEALLESKRILKKEGYFACMWNHRNLENSLQKEIEDVLKRNIENYSYGTRREEQKSVIEVSNLFGDVIFLEGTVNQSVLAEDFIEGWKSHGTVYRQSPEKFDVINKEIREVVERQGQKYIIIPYTTRIWMAKVK